MCNCGTCATCTNRVYMREYHRRHRDVLNAKRRARGSKSSTDRVRAWRAANPERAKMFRVSRETKIAAQHRRRARKRNAPGAATAAQIRDRVEYYGARCYLCSAPYEQIDHVIALARGGPNWPANLRPICARCNRIKSDRPLEVVLAV